MSFYHGYLGLVSVLLMSCSESTYANTIGGGPSLKWRQRKVMFYVAFVSASLLSFFFLNV